MILIEDILNLHEQSIKNFGGSSGIRDIGLLNLRLRDLFKLLVEKIYIHLLLIKPQPWEKV